MRRVVAVVGAVVVAFLVATPAVGSAVAAPAPPGVAEASHATPALDANAPDSVDDGRVETRGRTAAQDQTIQKHIRLFLTPETPGEVDVEVTYDLPESVTALRVNVPDDARDVESAAFTNSNGRYEWDGETDPAVLSFSLPANKTASGARAASVAQEGKYSFVDVGPWAVVTVPGLRTEWSWSSAEDIRVSLDEDVSVGGEGSTGGEIAYLGPMETYSRTASDQTFTLVVPERASLSTSPDEILDALEAASRRLTVGERDGEVWFVAAPTDADWGVRGVEFGGSDAWVLADSRLDDAGNVWFHEYVHTRQAFSTATTGRWATEASAEYYSGLLALRTDYVDFEAFERYLSYGERQPWRSAVLAAPSTWSSGANYVKGSLVWGSIDRQVRLATNSTATIGDVLYRLNQRDERVTNGDVVSAVEAVAGPSIAEYAKQYTETRDVPSMWTRAEHATAFGTTPPRMAYENTEYHVEGPFRNQSFSSPPTLYVGETLRVTGRVTNEGGQTGEYGAAVSQNRSVLAAAGGELAEGESDQFTFQHTVTEAGSYEVALGRTTKTLRVREPASVGVDSLTVSPENPSIGDEVTVTLGLVNPSSDYATGPVVVNVDGEAVTSVPVMLAPETSTMRSVAVQMDAGGTRVVAAGGESVSVSVGVASSGDDREGGTSTGIPGFGVLAALTAVAAAAAVVLRD